jgi:hypothetical protein
MPLEPGSVQTQGVPRGHETQHGVTSLWHRVMLINFMTLSQKRI